MACEDEDGEGDRRVARGSRLCVQGIERKQKRKQMENQKEETDRRESPSAETVLQLTRNNCGEHSEVPVLRADDIPASCTHNTSALRRGSHVVGGGCVSDGECVRSYE